MKKTGKALIGVLSVAALVGTGVATWTINGGIVTETTSITPTIAEIGTRNIAIDVTAKDSSLVFDNPDDLIVIYNVKAKAGTGAATGFEPYGYDFKNIVPEYQPNLSITTQVLRDGSPIDESDPFFDFVEVPSNESETKISYSDWLNVELKDKGYDATLTFAWGAETGGLNPQEYVDKNSSIYNTPELQREFFERVNAALDKITFTFTFKVGGLKDTPIETPDTGEITIPTVTGSTLTIDGMTGTTVEAGTHRITITTEEGKEVTDKKLTVIENGTTKNDFTLTEETLTGASGHTYYVDYEFKADTTYSFEYTLKDEEVLPTLYTVTYTQPENGTITLKNGDTDVADGDQVEENTNLTLTVKANEGYHITSVLVNDKEAGSEYTTTFTQEIPVTANLTISATMEKDEEPVINYEKEVLDSAFWNEGNQSYIEYSYGDFSEGDNFNLTGFGNVDINAENALILGWNKNTSTQGLKAPTIDEKYYNFIDGFNSTNKPQVQLLTPASNINIHSLKYDLSKTDDKNISAIYLIKSTDNGNTFTLVEQFTSPYTMIEYSNPTDEYAIYGLLGEYSSMTETRIRLSTLEIEYTIK